MHHEPPQVYPQPASIDPTLGFKLRLHVVTNVEIVVRVGGTISVDDRVISRLVDCGIGQQNQVQSLIPGENGRVNGPTMALDHMLQAPLSRAAIDHIEGARRKNGPGDVHLKCEFDVSWLTMTAGVLALRHGTPSTAGEVPILLARPQDPNAIVLPTDRGNALISVSNRLIPLEHRISGSDWTHQFAPAFGIGRFVVVELPDPSEALKDSKILAEWVEAIESARKARNLVQQGDDPKAMEALRKPMDLIRARLPDLEDLLQRDGYDAEGAVAFADMVRSQFTLFSKFLHRTDKTGKTMRPEITPQREDVLHAYSSTMTMLNVIARKAARFA